jgi:hypothetical protein
VEEYFVEMNVEKIEYKKESKGDFSVPVKGSWQL